MTQTTVRPRGGWQQEEIDVLFSAVKEAAETGKPLRGVFSDVGERLCRKPNSIRNYIMPGCTKARSWRRGKRPFAPLRRRNCTSCCVRC